MQYLATDGDAPLLQPTNSPILAYSPVKSDDVKLVKLEDIKHVGPQNTSPVLQFLELLGASCDALMSNAAILAEVKVNSMLSLVLSCNSGVKVPALPLGLTWYQ